MSGIESVMRKRLRSSLAWKVFRRIRDVTSFPVSTNIELTTACNSKCWFCPHTFQKVKVEEIDPKIFLKFIADLKELKTIYEITPVGLGETFLYSNWVDAFRTIRKEFPKITIKMATNGIAMDRDVSKELVSIFTKDTDNILISLNATGRENYKEMMGVDKFEQVRQNIQDLAELRDRAGRKFSIRVQTMKTIKTENKLEKSRLYWSKYLTKPNDMPIFVRELENWGGLINTVGKTTKIDAPRFPCIGLWKLVSIDQYGNAYPCCNALARRHNGSTMELGNIMDSSIKAIYRSEKYKRLRNLHLAGKWNDIPECVDCDLWSSAVDVWFRKRSGGFS